MKSTYIYITSINMGCRSSIIPFVCSFLTERRHRVRYKGATSDYAPITCGVPQGTRAGCVVFLALVNSFCRAVAKRGKFVDDLAMAHITNILNEIRYKIQPDLNVLNTQCTDKNMRNNPLKSEVMHYCPPKRPIVLPDLHLGDVSLPVVQQCKLLGVHLTTEMNWNLHVAEIIKKANKSIYMIRRAKQFQFSLHSLATLFQWYVRTILEYAAPVWHPGLTEMQHRQLELIQRRCVRIMLGQKYQGYEAALERLHLSPLRDRREMLTLRLGKSILRSPEHRSLLPPTMAQVHGRATRHGNRLRVPARTTARYQNTFVPYVVKKLNALM